MTAAKNWSESAGVGSCLAVVRTPLQLINASEYIYESRLTSTSLLIIRNAHRWRRSDFTSAPSIALWKEVTEFAWSMNPFNRGGVNSWMKVLGDVLDDIRFKRFLDATKLGWHDHDVLVIGNSKDLWTRHLANQMAGHTRVVECEDGAVSLNSNWTPSKSWQLRRTLGGFDAKDPALDEIYTSYEGVACLGAEVMKNEYRYLGSLFDQDRACITDAVWFVGQPLPGLSIMTWDRYRAVVAAIRGNYEGQGRFFYFPHPSENREDARRLCASLGIEMIEPDFTLETAILRAHSVPGRIASLYSSAISTVLKIFRGRIQVDVYRPEFSLFSGKMPHETYTEVYGWLERNICSPNTFFEISGESPSVQQPDRLSVT